MKVLKKTILPLGFKASGICCGIKKSDKKDLGLIYSDKLATACGMFTTNKIKAAPVLVTLSHIRNNQARVIIVNSGNANCMTKTGLKDAKEMASVVAKKLKIKTNKVLVASTGIIGRPLQIKKIKDGVVPLIKKMHKNGIDNVAAAIMTTDTKLKKISVKLAVNNKKVVTISGVAKGAGMIYPEMAPQGTMLAFIMTDAAIAPNALKLSLKNAVEDSFNCITVDGCRSTNDTVLILANGKAGNKKIGINDKAYNSFSNALRYACLTLAKKIVQDAEGATKFIEIKVKGVKNSQDAKKAAFTVANSSLLKTAIFGENKNLGRIYSAIGQTGIKINEKKIKVSTNSFKDKDIKISINLNMGKAESTVYASDLSIGYVRINARYN